MARHVALALLILAHIFLLMFMAQASVTNTSDMELPAFVQRRGVEEAAEEPSSSTDRDQPHLIEEGEEEDDGFQAEAPTSRRMGKHKGTDPSVAGGGVILGGLATAVFAAVFCYIRVTRRKPHMIKNSIAPANTPQIS